jgi:adenylosuccinate lyase
MRAGPPPASGVKPLDRIRRVNGRDHERRRRRAEQHLRSQVGDRLTLEVDRDGKSRTVTSRARGGRGSLTMIERYTPSEMAAAWSDDGRLRVVARGGARHDRGARTRGDVPAGTVAACASARAGPGAHAAIESEVHHDVIAFLSDAGASVGDDARHVHAGMTSSDLVDTALACQIRRRAGCCANAGGAAARRVGAGQKHRRTPMVGPLARRARGADHVRPQVPGVVEDSGARLDRLQAGLGRLRGRQVPGAVGTLAHLGPSSRPGPVAAGLEPEPVANQVVQRDRHAALLCALAVRAGTMDKIALEIRHLSAPRCARRRSRSRAAEGLVGDAAQAQPGALRARVGLARLCALAPGRRSRTRRCGTSATSATPRWSASRCPDAFTLAHFMAHDLAYVLEGLA